jgi:hypothetical protein
MQQRIFVSLACTLSLLIFSCRNHAATAAQIDPPAINEDSLVLAATQDILQIFAEQSFAKLADRIHPEKGVRFSPYAYVDTVNDVRLIPGDLYRSEFFVKKIRWGSYDGTGDPIELMMSEYINKFVYTADFLHAEKIAVNQVIGGGNTINNLAEIYPGKPFTESWFSGFDPKYEGMDWQSLRLVFEIEDGKAWLIAVIHDQWTI